MRTLVTVTLLVISAASLAACDRRYDQRDFSVPAQNPAWGTLFVNVISTGHWKEQGISVSGAPYELIMVPGLKAQPGPECKLTIRNLEVRRTSDSKLVWGQEEVLLHAKDPDPREGNQRPHSRYFTYIPLSSEYITIGKVKGISLAYEPHSLAFDLLGGPTCPRDLRGSQPIQMPITTDRMQGEASWLPSA